MQEKIQPKKKTKETMPETETEAKSQLIQSQHEKYQIG